MDAPPTVLFDSYSQDLDHLIASIREKLEGDGRTGIGEQRKAALRKAELELDEADDIVRSIVYPIYSDWVFRLEWALIQGLSVDLATGNRDPRNPQVDPSRIHVAVEERQSAGRDV